ncbi:MAG: hypothetical protein IJL08_06095 [Oscillospiraceae bacterium]|nr:hypothetical protein [Oscillospiraceae bacterium]
MKIELLYPELCYLYGDLANVRYLKKCCPSAEVVETHYKDRPAFLDGGVDLVYMGSGTEDGLSRAAGALRPYRDDIAAAIDRGQRFLITGNALDIFGEAVHSDDGLEIEGLGLFPFHSDYQILKRVSTFFLGDFEGMTVVGFQCVFGYLDGAPETEGLFTLRRGVGRNLTSKVEGFRRNNFMGTHLIGPLLVLNPPFAKYLLRELGAGDLTLPFEDTAMAAYEKRAAEMADEKIDYNFH